MRTGRYDLLTILEDQGLEQFVVPEIQRDYVWQIPDVQDFGDYIIQGFEGDESDKPYLGFIYAYNDRDYPYKYILIDGQQRITTIFLLLLAAHHKIGKGLPEYMFTRDHLKLQYKVRQATHDFISSLVGFCSKNPGMDFKVRDQIWYHTEYSTDRTIKNIINNFAFLRKWLDVKVENLQGFIKFIEEGVDLSYFDIEESRQGEDLYIYMNSRGRQLEPNETLKAKYLATTAKKERWGFEWEKWQDFFWKHKGIKADADAGFNDFLRMVQVLTMAKQNQTSDAISNFVTGKTALDPTFEMLPPTIEELADVYNAYEWFVNAPAIKAMYEALGEPVDFLTTIPGFTQRQAYFFRILPVIGFLYISECRDERTVLRFARFFYNCARKRDSIGKDIANQLPAAIKLMIEFAATEETFDACDLTKYITKRTTLIDFEEISKFTIIRSSGDKREEVEELLWEVEDHRIFEGEIAFLLFEHYDKTTKKFDLINFKKSWEIFQRLFQHPKEEHKVALALLYYGSTWLADSPHYYQNFACTNWRGLVRSEKQHHLMHLIVGLSDRTITIDSLTAANMRDYFLRNGLTTVDKLKEETRFFHQIAILAAIDYHTDKKFFSNNYGYIAKDNRFDYHDDPFFKNSPELFNVRRYIYEGYDGRLMRTMKNILQDQAKLQEIIDVIIMPGDQ